MDQVPAIGSLGQIPSAPHFPSFSQQMMLSVVDMALTACHAYAETLAWTKQDASESTCMDNITF